MDKKFKLSITNIANDSDASAETNSLSAESTTENVQHKPRKKLGRRRDSEWEVVEGLKEGQRFEKRPDLYNGFLHKKRKWPLKGWHKRYFVLDKGILIYGKNQNEINKGKVHGSVDIGLSVISSKLNGCRIDIDAEEFIYHLKAKTEDSFTKWLRQLTDHRLYRQHGLTYGSKMGLLSTNQGNERASEILLKSDCTDGLKSSKETHKLSTWLKNVKSPLEDVQHDINFTEKNLRKLAHILNQIDPKNGTTKWAMCPSWALCPNKEVGDTSKLGVVSKQQSGRCVQVGRCVQIKKWAIRPSWALCPNKEVGDTSKLGVVSKQQSGRCVQVGRCVQIKKWAIRPSWALCPNKEVAAFLFPIKNHLVQSLPQREDFRHLYRVLHVFSTIKNVVSILTTEKDALNDALNEEKQTIGSYSINADIICGLKNSLKEALHQNSELRRRLKAIHDTSDSSNLSHLHPKENSNSSLSCNSSCVSASEYFDAEDLPKDDHGKIGLPSGDFEVPLSTRGSDTSSEAGSLSSNDSMSSESDAELEYSHANNKLISEGGQGLTGRRTVLPVARPATEGLSLWNILYKNIGKDLSQISMPVALNEPLNILQRLCEELEYSELLDKAAEVSDPYERMVYVAAFAVSAYASSYSRAGNKPFNPLLGETYECIREDKGFKFLAEQVSHHPPISACYAESRNFIFWQEARVKTKFWGKSMEFQPLGKVYLLFPNSGDTYSWNKVTTCVHNLFSGQRWVDQYGELHITNNHISCKLTFAKTNYWSSKRHEVVGTVYDENGKSVRSLFGKWSEALYCGVAPSARCIWRAGTLPPNHEQLYGFTRFAIELNEVGPDSHLLPPTDTRLRPDQRALELGNLHKAEQLKLQLENAQRERRKQRIGKNLQYKPLWFCQNSNTDEGEEWQYNGKYWDIRKNCGFSEMQFEPLW
ncbi:hypothetical protein FQR65_LT04235 [Abscondita terminalis]|nr:hypothetical protein FQR65_LT04235 [Abscondita terminalis]